MIICLVLPPRIVIVLNCSKPVGKLISFHLLEIMNIDSHFHNDVINLITMFIPVIRDGVMDDLFEIFSKRSHPLPYFFLKRAYQFLNLDLFYVLPIMQTIETRGRLVHCLRGINSISLWCFSPDDPSSLFGVIFCLN